MTLLFENLIFTKRLILFSCLLFIFQRFLIGLSLFGLSEPELIYVGSDNTYWILHLLNIPQLSLRTPFNWIIDICFVITILSQIIWVKNKYLTIISICLTTLHSISFFSCLGNQNHTYLGILFIQFPLIFIDNRERFLIWFAGLRYYTLFLYVSSGFWKLFRGNLEEPDRFMNVFISQNIDYLVSFDGSLIQNIIYWMFQLSFDTFWFFWIVLTFFQLFISIGFFIRRFDYVLMVLMFLFHLVSAFFFQIWSFFPVAILLFSFLVKPSQKFKSGSTGFQIS